MTPTASKPLAIAVLLHRWLARQVTAEGCAWLEEKCRQVARGAPRRAFFTGFSAVPRYVARAALQLGAQDQQEAAAVRPGWQPGRWSTDEAARALLLLALPHEADDAYERWLRPVFEMGDVGELVALYQSLPLLPAPARYAAQAREGGRSNMTSVFEAVALRNPYPAEQFDEGAWNQVVLKAVFVGSPLADVYGLDRRANATLAHILVDYAHERWAAGRVVTPELWRPVGPFAEGAVVADLERVLNDEAPAQQEAAALALSQSPSEEARALLARRRPDLQARVARGTLTWDRLVQSHLTARRT